MGVGKSINRLRLLKLVSIWVSPWLYNGIVIATARLVYVGDMNSSVEGRTTEGALKMEVATEHGAVQAVVGCRCCVG
jgi:hypothetical protein